MALFKILVDCSGAHDAAGVDVHRYAAGQVVSLPASLAEVWVRAGMAEPVPAELPVEARETKVVAPQEKKPAAPSARKRHK